MTKSVCCGHGKMFYINFLQVFSIKFSVNLSSRHLVYVLGTTMEIRVTRPSIVSFIPGDQYGGPDVFIIMLTCTVYRNKSINPKKTFVIEHTFETKTLAT